MGLKLSELDGIVFDMDGVIFDSEVIGLESWERLGKKYGLTNVHENAMKCIGRSTVDTMAILEAKCQYPNFMMKQKTFVQILSLSVVCL